jgi:hypothetical protein
MSRSRLLKRVFDIDIEHCLNSRWRCHIVEHEDNEMTRPYGIGRVQSVNQANIAATGKGFWERLSLGLS